jgi:hypothetical protein
MKRERLDIVPTERPETEREEQERLVVLTDLIDKIRRGEIPQRRPTVH